MKHKILLVLIGMTCIFVSILNLKTALAVVDTGKHIVSTLESLGGEWGFGEWGTITDGENFGNEQQSWTQPKKVACKLDLGGGWFTGSIERICVFCTVPNTCTPVECGVPF